MANWILYTIPIHTYKYSDLFDFYSFIYDHCGIKVEIFFFSFHREYRFPNCVQISMRDYFISNTFYLFALKL